MVRKTWAIAAAAALVLAACGSDSDDGDGAVGAGAGGGDGSAEVTATIESPADGDTVTSPLVVKAKADGIEIAPAADEVEGAGHFHVMVNTDCVAEGEPIPKDDNHLHFGDGSTDLDLGDLDPGEHTLCLQIGDNTHIATGATDTITITVDGDHGEGDDHGDDGEGDEVSASFDGVEDGDTIASPVVVKAKADGIEIHPAADEVEGAGHFHVMVNTDCVAEGEPIPKDDNHLHFGDGSTELDLGELEPGEYTLCLQIGDNTHIATGATDTITITVEG